MNSEKLSIVFLSYKDIPITQHIKAAGTIIGQPKITHTSKITKGRRLSDKSTANIFLNTSNHGQITINNKSKHIQCSELHSLSLF